MQETTLPSGFISVKDAIDLINSDTRSDAKVDTAFLLRNLPYLRVDGNYTIKKLRHDKGMIVDDGNVFVHIASSYDKEMFQHAVTEHYRAATGRDINPEAIGVRNLTTAVDDEVNAMGRIMVNDKPSTKFGDDLKSGVIDPNKGV